jgi:hypothetical protein
VAGHFFEDVGAYALSGSAAGVGAGTVVTVYRRASSQPNWNVFTRATTDSRSRYGASVPVRERDTFVFLATMSGAPSQTGVLASNSVSARVEDSSVLMNPVVKSIDTLRNPTIGGRVIPGRPGVTVDIEVKKSGRYVAVAKTRTAGNGSFSSVVSYGQGALAGVSVRSTYHAQNRPRTESTSPQTFTRAAVLHAVVTRTTTGEVAKTYHAGCPVGPSKLRTITMNFYGFDARMHRGVLVVRSDLTTKIIRGFASALAHRFPIAKMDNPNLYGGNDPRQMAADNTSAFNCRKVVGNPYQMSPHSYGIAVDVNTVQNPYRDVSGRWWPSNGRSYLDRTPLRRGMLGTISYLTRSLRHDKFFWGGFWYPGRDYQHFEYRP